MDENPKENMEKPENDDRLDARQRIMLAIRQKAALAATETGAEVEPAPESEAEHQTAAEAGLGSASLEAGIAATEVRAAADAPAEIGTDAPGATRSDNRSANAAAFARGWNRWIGDDDDDDDAGYGDDSVAHTANSGAEEGTPHSGIAGRRTETLFGEDARSPTATVPPNPLNEAIRHRTIALERLNSRNIPFERPLSQLNPSLCGDPRLARPAPPGIGNGEAAQLLEGLIAECHFLMRELVLPSAMESADPEERRRFLSTAMDLAQTGATVAKTVAKLRRGAPPASASRFS